MNYVTEEYTILPGEMDAVFRDDGSVDFDLGGGRHVLLSAEAWNKLVLARRAFLMQHSRVDLGPDVDERTRQRAAQIASQIRANLRKRDEQ